MDLKSLIRPQLWNELSNSYLAENYRTSILDAMRYLTQIIREKSGLDSDGIPLVGQAFGGDEPKLRLNKLQTQSEKDEQKGFQFIVSGLYSAIRNPRTHENILDNKNTADPIIYFINYILSIIDVARPPFEIEEFLPRVFDEGFVKNEIYVRALIEEIPKNKYLETLIEIYRRKSHPYAEALAYVFKEIWTHLKESEIKEFMDIVSTELDVAKNNGTIALILRILPRNYKYWSMVKLTAKLRIENKLIASINKGQDSMNSPIIQEGVLGTWATRIIDQFTLTEELVQAIVSSLKIDDYRYNRYILNFFLPYLSDLLEDPKHQKYCALAMKNVIRYQDHHIRDQVMDFLASCPENWSKIIKDEFKDWTDEEHPEFYLPDGSPFLGKVPYETLPLFDVEDDIPF